MNRNLDPKRARGPYQCLDPLSPEDFKTLEADILERGVLIPIEYDEDGNVIDGHHRLMICERHGITDYPTIVRKGWTEQEKRTHARRMNLARRHLTREQRRKLIEAELREYPEGSNRKIAATLGVDDKTVGAVRRTLEKGAEIPHLDSRVGIGGMVYKTVRRSPGPSAGTPTDADGNVVPAPLIPVFQALAEFASLDNALTDIRRRMLDLGKICGPLKAKDHLIRRYTEKLQGLLGVNRPELVHCDCGGTGCEKCDTKGYRTAGEIPQREDGEDGIEKVMGKLIT